MKLSNRIKCIVYLLYAYLVILTICASVLLVLGAFLLYNHLSYNTVIQNNVWIPCGALCAIAMVEYLISYFGWRSIVRRHNCLIGLFCASLIFLIIAQLGLTAWVLTIRRDVHIQSRINVYKSFNDFFDSGLISDQTHVWNRLQMELRCCGAHGISDFADSSIPWSCYNRPEPGSAGKQILYERGCLTVLVDDSKQRLLYIVIAAVASSFVQVYGIFCTINLIHLLKVSKKAIVNSSLGSRVSSPIDRNTESMPFASMASASSTGSPSKMSHHNPHHQLHDNLQMDLKRATAERMSRRQMSQKKMMDQNL